MNVLDRHYIKVSIELSHNVEEADKVINEKCNFKSINEKIAFLKEMFNVEVVDEHDAEDVSEEESLEMTYWSMLNTVLVL